MGSAGLCRKSGLAGAGVGGGVGETVLEGGKAMVSGERVDWMVRWLRGARVLGDLLGRERLGAVRKVV